LLTLVIRNPVADGARGGEDVVLEVVLRCRHRARDMASLFSR
jgi:hypothetical protein